MREVAWRHSTLGSPVTDEDREYIRIHGMKPKEGMKSIDFLRAIDHVLDSNLGRPLLSFSLGETLSPLGITEASEQTWCGRVLFEIEWARMCVCACVSVSVIEP